ncbi:MAG: hypothetical protein AB7Q69_05700, partial [Gemmatimonadales bacterium]
MYGKQWPAAVLLLVGVAACADRATPTAPPTDPAPRHEVAADTAEAGRLERLARDFALALGDDEFRAEVHRTLQRSTVREHKMHFQRFLGAAGDRGLSRLARASGAAAEAVAADAGAAEPLEVYLPVPEHRDRWTGDARLLVATAQQDGDIPVAYDPAGRRYVLDPERPPETPVIALVPVETAFDDVASPAQCLPEECNAGGPGSGGGMPATPAGLFMTLSHFNDDYEGWLKGSPEFEIHVLGQSGGTDSLVSLQCAGEHAGGPYRFDQNNLDWTGSVLLFSQAQLDTYKAQHPGQSLRILAVEDDDTACQIKNGTNTLASIFAAVDAAYNLFTGGRDTVSGLQKAF